MKEEKQRIAIAEACGWRWTNETYGGEWYLQTPRGISSHWFDLPNYLHDLNAMHEAVVGKITTIDLKAKYSDALIDVLRRPFPKEALQDTPREEIEFILLNATAPQRAEAFLRTLNLWEEL